MRQLKLALPVSLVMAWLCVNPHSSRAQAGYSPQSSGEDVTEQASQVAPDDYAAAPAATSPVAATETSSSDAKSQAELQAKPQAPAASDKTSPDSPSVGSPIDPSTGKPLDRPFFHNFMSEFLHDQYHMWRGPFHTSNYNGRTMRKYGIPFLLISAGLIASDRSTARWLPNTSDQVIWSGRVSQIGAPYTLAGFAGVYYGIGRATSNAHASETGFLALEALGDSQLIALVLKEVTQRQRPSAPNVRGTGFWNGGSSFPSGHALGSFAVASVFAYEYRQHLAVPIVAYSLATIVDLSRFGARAHWYSDVFVGSSMGFLIGRYVYKNHHDPDLPGSPVPKGISKLKPTFGAGQQGVGLYWKL